MRFDPDLKFGEEINSKRAVEIFKGNSQKGMRRSIENGTLTLISKQIDKISNDRWIDDEHTELYYTGMGLTGDQKLDFDQNRTLNESKTNGVDVHLLIVNKPGVYTYMGRVILNSEQFQEEQIDEDGQTRTVWMFPLKLIDSPNVTIDLALEEDDGADLDEIGESVIEDDIDKRVTLEDPPLSKVKVYYQNFQVLRVEKLIIINRIKIGK